MAVLPANETLSFILTQVDIERRTGGAPYKFGYRGQEDLVRRLRPVVLSAGEVTFNGDSWPDIFDKVDGDASCLSVTVNGDTISLELDASKATTKDIKVGDNTKTVVLCK